MVHESEIRRLGSVLYIEPMVVCGSSGVRGNKGDIAA